MALSEARRKYAREYQARRRAADPAYRAKQNRYVRETYRLKTYGLAPDQFDALLLEQDGLCAGCGDDLAAVKTPCVDHCHATGVVRGLLCSHCNLALGHLKDDVDRIRRLADYLERSTRGGDSK